MSDLTPPSLCWKCSKPQGFRESPCPHCGATNPNVDLPKAVAECDAGSVSRPQAAEKLCTCKARSSGYPSDVDPRTLIADPECDAHVTRDDNDPGCTCHGTDWTFACFEFCHREKPRE